MQNFKFSKHRNAHKGKRKRDRKRCPKYGLVKTSAELDIQIKCSGLANPSPGRSPFFNPR